MPRITPLLVLLLPIAIACSSAGGPAERSSGPPNVVVVLADDQGWGDLSLHGNTNLATPNIDSLARDGAMFEHFYVSSVCAPTRAEFLTGRYFARGGVRGVSTGQERLNIDEHTIAQSFRRAGYATGAFGKWHNGTQHPYHPNARGFEEFYGFTEGHWGHYFDYEMDHNGQLVEGEGFVIDDVTNRALAFIDENRERPFFAYLPYNTPHSPMQVPDEYWDRFESKDLAMRHRNPESEDVPKTRAALAMVENIDWNVGRVLAKLEEAGLASNTIVLYFSDNGPNSWRWNGGMKGRKGSLDEGGLRSPLVLRWSGHVPAGTVVGEIAGAIDLLPTLADLTGIEVGASKPLDGRSPRAAAARRRRRVARAAAVFAQDLERTPAGQRPERPVPSGPGRSALRDRNRSRAAGGRRGQVSAGCGGASRRGQGLAGGGGGQHRARRPAVSGRALGGDAAPRPGRSAARGRGAQRPGAELLVLHELDEQAGLDHMGRRSGRRPGTTRSRSTTPRRTPGPKSRRSSKARR